MKKGNLIYLVFSPNSTSLTVVFEQPEDVKTDLEKETWMWHAGGNRGLTNPIGEVRFQSFNHGPLVNLSEFSGTAGVFDRTNDRHLVEVVKAINSYQSSR